MKKLETQMPSIKNTLDGTVDNYPQGFNWGSQEVIRAAFVKDKEFIIDGGSVEVTVTGFGVVTFRGRKFTFVPTAEYARAKGYEDEITGSWG